MKKLMKSASNISLFGVCSEIAEYFQISPFIVRMIFIFTPCFLLLYFVLAFLLPEDPSLY